jgi:RHS repeat-associated protein
LHYNDNGFLNKLIDSANREITLQYNQQNKIASIQIPHPDMPGKLASVVHYSYNDSDNLVQAADGVGKSNIYLYKNRLLVQRILPNGSNFYWKYDGENTGAKCIRTWGDNNYLAYDFQYFDNKTIVTNSLGNTAIYLHKNGLVTREINSRSAQKRFNYNAFSELTNEFDALDNITFFEYDARGHKTLTQWPDGSTVSTVYKNDLPVSSVDPKGCEWLWKYDEAGNLTERILPTGSNVQYTYHNGLLTATIDGAGNTTRFNYDKDYNLKDVIAPDNTISSWLYDKLGRCTKYTDAGGNTTWSEYDIKGRLVKINEPDGNVRHFEYDGLDNVIRATDRERKIRFEYGPTDNVIARYEGNSTIKFKYNTEEELTEIINEQGHQYTFLRDSEGDVIRETGFDGITYKYQRDLAGRIIKVLKPGNESVSYWYDKLDQVVQTSHSNGENITYTYDRSGLLTEAVNQHAFIRFEYDSLGRKIKENQNGSVIISEYDVLNNRIHITSDQGADVQIHYTEMGEVAGISTNNWNAKMQYDELGMETRRFLPGSIITKWVRDKTGRPIEQVISNNTRRRTRLYKWQINDKLSEITDNSTGPAKFEHDVFGNLIGAVYGNGNKQYRVPDIVSNYFKTPDGTDRKYGKAGQLIESDTYSYRYDGCGNLIEKKDKKKGDKWRYEWYASGMLKKVLRPEGETIQFEYDPLGRRIAKHTALYTTRWIWDGNVPLHEWKEKRMSPGNVENLITWIFEEDNFVPAAKIEKNKQYSIIADHLGTPLEMCDSNGNVSWSMELDSYGKLRNFKGDAPGDCPFRYQGQYEDAETGLYYNRFRYYDPEAGIYISQDPIGLEGGLRLYHYVPDSIIWIDGFGLKKRGPKTDPNAPHNKAISDWGKEIKADGGTVLNGGGVKPETTVDIPGGGHKGTRRPDIIWQDKHGNINYGNVGRTNSKGKPVKREINAMQDLNKSRKAQQLKGRTQFRSYTHPQFNKKIC